MTLETKEEPLDWLEKFAEEAEHLEGTSTPRNGVFNRPTDVTWDNDGNIFVTDGYNNSRLAKFTKDGVWVGAIGERGSAPNQFNTPHGSRAWARPGRSAPRPGLRSACSAAMATARSTR